MTGRAPLWLARPSWLGTLDRRAAQGGLALTLAALIGAVATTRMPRVPFEGDHRAIVEAMRHDGDFYGAIDLLSRGGTLDPTFPPALARLTAAIGDGGMIAVVSLLSAILLYAGTPAIITAYSTATARIASGVLFVCGLVAVAMASVSAPHLGVAALLVAIALLLRRPGRWIEPAAAGCIAALIAPFALIATATMGAAAALEKRRDETLGWSAATLLAGAAALAHDRALHGMALPPLTRTAGPGAVEALAGTALPLLPGPIAALAIVGALLGWVAIGDALARRIGGVLLAGAIVQWLTGAPAAALTAAVLPAGLAALPDALRDLSGIARGRRRLTVTRTVRSEPTA